MDPREVLIDTKNMGQVSIPKHEIKEIKLIKSGDVSADGEYLPSETFATRYFITTNGLPIAKGESYVLWNWYGPDVQFGVAKNFSLGVISTWFVAPVIASAKYSLELDANTHLGVGTLLGTGSWVARDFHFALPFASLTWGNRRSNFTVSGGYGEVWQNGSAFEDHPSHSGRALCSVAGMTKVSKKTSLVFDSFIFPGNGRNLDYFALYNAGFRVQTRADAAFQLGFLGISSTNDFVPIPMVQFFRKL
jgi:hypothetical protein